MIGFIESLHQFSAARSPRQSISRYVRN